MPSAWTGTVCDLKRSQRRGILTDGIATGYRARFAEPSLSDKTCWRESIGALLSALADSAFDGIQVVVEMQMPVGAERADVVLLGGTAAQPHALLLELKQWTGATLDAATLELSVPGIGVHQHPSLQVLGYAGKLRLFHSRAAQYEMRSAVFLHNMRDRELLELRSGAASGWSAKAPLYGVQDARDLARDVGSFLLPIALPSNEHRVFASAPYEQTRHLTDIIRAHATDIADRAVTTLAESGIALTEEQERLVETILASARAREPRTFVVEGGPGSGKTLVAVTLLLRALATSMRAGLAMRNNRLQAILKQCFNESYRGASGVLHFFKVSMHRTGLCDDVEAEFDLLICDESQRMQESCMVPILRRAPTSCVFLDETQRLNPPEEGTYARFASAVKQLGRTVVRGQLSAAVRCRGGAPYHTWVESLLDKPSAEELAVARQPWRSDYTVRVCASAEQLVETLRTWRDAVPTKRVALVASFSESPGSSKSADHPDNVRIGYPLSSGWDHYQGSSVCIRWLMRPDEYVRFWMNGSSNSLDRVASIYGAQGFESDFVGVVWGRDFVGREGRWVLGPAEACFDTIDGLVTRARNRRWASEAFELVRNRYRIFLTRGILGTAIYAEDDETREMLRTLVESHMPVGPNEYP
jgi:DUF2075 family protein